MADWIIDKNDVNSTVDGNFILYKNRPLVREDNIMVYGSNEEKYVVKMTVMSMTQYKEHSVPGKIYIQLLKTDPAVTGKDKVEQEAIKDGFSEALDFAVAWLDSRKA